MRTYVLKKVEGRPDWDTIAVMPIDCLQWTEPAVPIRAYGQLCWDRNGIFVRLAAREPKIRAVHTGPMQAVCEDSCLEFFFRPTEDMRYFNIEYNCNCAVYLGFGSSIRNLVRLTFADEKDLFCPTARTTDEGWEIQYYVPFSFVRQFFPSFSPRVGLTMYGNCYKCGDLTETPHYLAWNRLRSGTPQFHRPDDFGRLILGD